ncbi:sensor histidine kinase [Mucilaginibacter sp. KACC 22063]|uniref:sensor histidine kinase n=1 Tax=Mucilaginibacter sp. KACC 22063 TaxID=3025666 RepID=UPI002365ED4B|nr:7TM diverse intracellular signaling domain-containing protein [Mucilaginibacter sp. KACC 22063]WDF54268.1 7TM diverse intracellular signaling domain-containing protein [Mucilaginibacter sp. KACC 22063]
MKKFLLFVSLILCCASVFAADTLVIHNNESKLIPNTTFTQLEDPDGTLTFYDVLKSNSFHKVNQPLPHINYTTSVIWLKLTLKNKTTQPYLPVSIRSSVIDEFDLYYLNASKQPVRLVADYPHLSLSQLEQNTTHVNFVILPDSSKTIYLRVKSNGTTVLPVEVYSATSFMKSVNFQNLVIGAFMGVIVIMAVYNLVLFFIVGDISYVYYVLYIIFLGLTQILLRGYGTNLISGDKQVINDIVLPVCRVCFGFSILFFVYEFLQIKQQGNIILWSYRAMFAIYTLPLLTLMAGFIHLTYTLIAFSALTTSIFLLVIGSMLYFKGFKPAKYFMFGWTLFFLSIITSIARSQGFVIYNTLTVNIILYGSALELILFSAALADKINFYRQQISESQIAALAIAVENEKLITQQNILLENKVSERTRELIQSNQNLSRSIENLKAAQTKLVETEKMASLGQLTAGIAHEINNPINFVSASVNPLRMDFVEIFELIDKYVAFERVPDNTELQKDVAQYRKKIDVDFVKDEITTLLDGIEEGAGRTKEIVDSLRTFSRTDEQSLKPADINKAVLSTLVILRSTTPAYISITPVLDKLPLINCYPGKIGQVLINLITNSIHAIESKPVHNDENILIITTDHENHISIVIRDTGIGISDDVKQHIFDPFYTTKDVGEGTGLGLSIVFGIIEKHKGKIEVQSEPGMGATFLISLPKDLS